jgi:hypothetical protein
MFHKTARIALAVAVLLIPLLIPAEALAQRDANAMGSKYTLSVDQLAGFRIGAVNAGVGSANGFSYAGPIGVVHQSYTEHRFNNTGDDVTRTTTIWFAPSADIFVFDFPLSIGALFEISSTSGSLERQRNGTGITDTFDLATTTNITFLPRIGYLIVIADRFGIWPRGGVGYASRQLADPNNPGDKFGAHGFITDIDVGFLWRPVDNVFLRLGPEIAFSLGGSHTATAGGTTTSADASIFQIGLLGGIGVMFNL